MNNNRKKILTLVYLALYVALYIVLKYVGNLIPFLKMPNGGSIELELVAVFISSYHLGFGWGLINAIISMVVSWMFWQPWYINPLQLFFDYLGPLAICGLASILWPLKNMNKTSAVVASLLLGIITYLAVYICFDKTIWAIVGAVVVAIIIFVFAYKYKDISEYYGIAIAMIIKGLFHVISGAYYWVEGMAAGSLEAWIFSINYNLWYNLVTMAICIILVPILANQLKKANIKFIE